jgi:hypothetical protein
LCFRTFFLIPVVLACFALSPAPKALTVSPAPAGGYTINEKSLS